VAPASVSADAGKNLDVIADDKPDATFGIQSDKGLNIFRIDAAMIAASLPGLAGVIAELFLLNPYDGVGKQIDAAHMVPMRVTHDDVGDLLGLDTGQFFYGKNVVSSAAD